MHAKFVHSSCVVRDALGARMGKNEACGRLGVTDSF